MDRPVLDLISVSPDGDTSLLAASTGVRAMLWSRVFEGFEILGLDPLRAPESWITVACDRALWRKANNLVAEKYRAKANADTWQNRHHGELSHNDLITNTALQTLDAAGRTECPKCGVWCYNIHNHTLACSRRLDQKKFHHGALWDISRDSNTVSSGSVRRITQKAPQHAVESKRKVAQQVASVLAELRTVKGLLDWVAHPRLAWRVPLSATECMPVPLGYWRSKRGPGCDTSPT